MPLALLETDFRDILRRGINDADVVTLSPDRRMLHVDLSVKHGVGQIHVLVAADNNKTIRHYLFEIRHWELKETIFNPLASG